MLPHTLLILLGLIAASAAECGISLSGSRIVGGTDTGGFLYPWFALLRLRKSGDPPVCAGSLITPNHILTAAHCFSVSPGTPNEDLFTVALGVYNRCDSSESTKSVYNVRHVDVHEEYTSSEKFHDIALITLDTSADAPPVCLPAPGTVSGPQPGLLVGFGVTKEGNRKLPCRQRQARVTRFTPEQCADTKLPDEDTHEPTVFCGGGTRVDSCQGDSGGPFLTQSADGRYIVSGIVSYGYGCANNDLPGVYTDVASYLDWIQQKMQQRLQPKWDHKLPAVPQTTRTSNVAPNAGCLTAELKRRKKDLSMVDETTKES